MLSVLQVAILQPEGRAFLFCSRGSYSITTNLCIFLYFCLVIRSYSRKKKYYKNITDVFFYCLIFYYLGFKPFSGHPIVKFLSQPLYFFCNLCIFFVNCLSLANSFYSFIFGLLVLSSK